MIEIAALANTLRAEHSPGYALYPAFATSDVCRTMLSEAVAIARTAAAEQELHGAIVTQEGQTDLTGELPEQRVSKIFKLHRRPAFGDFLRDPRILDMLEVASGPDVDCFLSQFIFKNPGARGQPWHQDSYYFPFVPARPVVALWLAVTRATLDNGCLHVLPGSQSEEIHEHVPDRRPNANYGYVEIIDHDMSASEPCLLEPGDLLVFDSHLMHSSTDNLSDELRAAMVWHFAASDTVDLGQPQPDGTRRTSIVNDWQPLLRGGEFVT